eukprot:s36_g60.t1
MVQTARCLSANSMRLLWQLRRHGFKGQVLDSNLAELGTVGLLMITATASDMSPEHISKSRVLRAGHMKDGLIADQGIIRE